MKRTKIISMGEVLWDLFPDGERFGGASANFACHCAILGAEVTMVSAVGNDERGLEAIGILGDFGIDTSLMQTVPASPTGTVGVRTDGLGKPQFTIHENSAWDQLAWTPRLAARVSESDAVYFGTLGQRGRSSRATIQRALDAAESAGVLRILDINLRPPFFDQQLIRESIGRASILKLSDDEFNTVAQTCGVPSEVEHLPGLRTILQQFELDSIVMTRGAEGALFVSAEGEVEQPGVPTKVIDTVGAGDSFTAAFVLGLLGGEHTQSLLKNACQTASEVCSKPGAIPIPVAATAAK
ncbi:MAG: carbohydrate kinase [Verrucomicrobiota bacterium]